MYDQHFLRTQHTYLYKRSDIVVAIQQEIFQGLAVHVTPPGNDLALEDVIFIAFKNAFQTHKATFKYAVWPVNVRHFGDFLGASSLSDFSTRSLRQ